MTAKRHALTLLSGVVMSTCVTSTNKYDCGHVLQRRHHVTCTCMWPIIDPRCNQAVSSRLWQVLQRCSQQLSLVTMSRVILFEHDITAESAQLVRRHSVTSNRRDVHLVSRRRCAFHWATNSDCLAWTNTDCLAQQSLNYSTVLLPCTVTQWNIKSTISFDF